MRLLYVGAASGTSKKRYMALQANGYDCSIIDPKSCLPVSYVSSRWSYKTGALGLSSFVNKCVLRTLDRSARFDAVLVDNGELVSSTLLSIFRERSEKIALLNLDNPYSRRDGQRFRLVRKNISQYDAFFTPRESTAQEALRQGAREAYVFWQAADDGVIKLGDHLELSEHHSSKPRISFTGTWMEDRDRFFWTLLQAGIDVKISGPRWQKAPLYQRLRENVQLGQLSQSEFYAAISVSAISIGLLSAGNDDLHTTRSIEIPALGSLLVAPRTEDHKMLYEDGREAFFWDDSRECIDVLHRLSKDPELLAKARKRGRARALMNNNFNGPLMRSVVEAIMSKEVPSAHSKVRRIFLSDYAR